jgi:hypothetical protein
MRKLSDLLEQLPVPDHRSGFWVALEAQLADARSNDDPIQSEPDEGDLIMVDIQIRPTDTDQPADEDRRRWLPYTILAAAAALLVIVALTLFDGSEETTPVDVVDSPDVVVTPELDDSTAQVEDLTQQPELPTYEYEEVLIAAGCTILPNPELHWDCAVGTDLSGANLRRADLFSADLSVADLAGANLSVANLFGADLSSANLSNADLAGANLGGADLRRADLSGADLRRADLSGADLGAADLSSANLFGADLSSANLSNADLAGANLTNADLSNANLTNADLTGAIGYP